MVKYSRSQLYFNVSAVQITISTYKLVCDYNHWGVDFVHFTEWSNLTFDQPAYSVVEGETVDLVIVPCEGTIITGDIVVSVIAGDGGTAGLYIH